jgi:hypothetical protein
METDDYRDPQERGNGPDQENGSVTEPVCEPEPQRGAEDGGQRYGHTEQPERFSPTPGRGELDHQGGEDHGRNPEPHPSQQRDGQYGHQRLGDHVEERGKPQEQ